MNKPIYLFLVPFFPTENCHGGSYIYDQVKAIQAAAEKYNVVVLKDTANTIKDGDYEYRGVRVSRFRQRNLPSALWPGFFDRYNFKSLDECLKRLNIEVNDIAVVHAHMIRQGMYAAYLKKQNPHIVSLLQHHGYDVLAVGDGRFAHYGWHKRHVINYGTKICNAMDMHIGVSQATLDQLDNYPSIKIKDKYVLYNGVDMDAFHPIPTEVNKQFTIGCVANFWEIKDQITLIKAVQILGERYRQDIKAKLVGTGFTLEYCKRYVLLHHLEDKIIFQDNMPHHKLIHFYNSLDLFVLPSYWDTLGCVYLEAYACGVPFMSAEGTGIKELIPVDECSKWIAPKSDPERLAKMIYDYIEHRYPQTLSQSININDLVSNFLKVIDNKRSELSR